MVWKKINWIFILLLDFVRLRSRFVIFNLDFPIFRRVCVQIYIFHSYQRLKLGLYDFLIEKRVHEISFKIVVELSF